MAPSVSHTSRSPHGVENASDHPFLMCPPHSKTSFLSPISPPIHIEPGLSSPLDSGDCRLLSRNPGIVCGLKIKILGEKSLEPLDRQHGVPGRQAESSPERGQGQKKTPQQLSSCPELPAHVQSRKALGWDRPGKAGSSATVLLLINH